MLTRKIGRNESCPCGSGKKYKHCCGGYRSQIRPWSALPQDARAGIEKLLAQSRAKEARRRQQQGLGRPIVSFESNDQRFVAVGNTIYWSNKWKTFHDFLFHYVKEVFGLEWGAQEQKKSLNQRHILMRWNAEVGDVLSKQQALTPTKEIMSGPSTPIVRAYLGLAYNLYLMKHNVTLQNALVARLKSPHESSFHGAYYEAFVAGIFIRGGFDIAFENEKDGSSSHCEFVASSRITSTKFSVEAKSRFRGSIPADTSPSKLKLGVREKLAAALQKKADYSRVVFIDVNVPDVHASGNKPFWADSAFGEMRELEDTMRSAGQQTPAAYVIVTNHPYQFDAPSGMSAVMEGFNISDWKYGVQFPSLRAALDARDRHAEILQIFVSMQTHYDVPATFDAEMPERHFSPDRDNPALQIGRRYVVPCPDGVKRPGELVNAIVVDAEKLVYGTYRLDSGKDVIATCPITEAELETYKKYPDTFFGVLKSPARQCKDLIEWYDFFFETYGSASKETLLEFMKSADDFESLKDLSREELARTYCERLAYAVGQRR